MHQDNIESREQLVLSHGFKVCTVARYLGGYIGDDKYKRDWLKKRTETWERNIFTLRKTAGKYTKESYAMVVRLIQSEWIFPQRFANNTGDAFSGVANMIQEIFLPHP